MTFIVSKNSKCCNKVKLDLFHQDLNSSLFSPPLTFPSPYLACFPTSSVLAQSNYPCLHLCQSLIFQQDHSCLLLKSRSHWRFIQPLCPVRVCNYLPMFRHVHLCESPFHIVSSVLRYNTKLQIYTWMLGLSSYSSLQQPPTFKHNGTHILFSSLAFSTHITHKTNEKCRCTD